MATVGKLARRGRSIATLQSATTPRQGLATWRPGFQNRQQKDPRQRDTIHPEWPEDLEECALSDAPAHSH